MLGDMYVSLSRILGDIWSKKGQNLAFVRARENPDPISGFNKAIHMLLKTCLAALTVKHSRAITKNDVSVSNLHIKPRRQHNVGICPGSGVFKTRCDCAISAGVLPKKVEIYWCIFFKDSDLFSAFMQ